MRPLLLLAVLTTCSAPSTAPSSTQAFVHAAITALTEHPSRTVRFAAMTARGRLLRAVAIPPR